MGARREVLSAVAERYRSAGRMEKGRILDALCRTTGWHRKHAVRALRRRVIGGERSGVRRRASDHAAARAALSASADRSGVVAPA
jgi:hypothetical protein